MNTIIIGLGLAAIALAVGALFRTASSKKATTAPPTMADPAQARRLARAIASDISLYHSEACQDARRSGEIPASLTAALDEGRALFAARVHPSLVHLFDEAVDDIGLLKRKP